MNKKILSLVIVLSLLVGSFNMSFASTTKAADERVNSLIKAGLISGYGDGSLGLEKPITRAEFSLMLAKTLVDDESEMDKYKNHSSFSDVDKDNWSAASINMLFDKGIVNGYKDGTFKASNEINFNEIIVMVIRSMDLEIEAGSTWSEGYVKVAKELGILKNTQQDNYLKSATRQDVVDILYNTLELNK